MRRILSCLAALFAVSVCSLSAGAIRSIDIDVLLNKDGSARITERWDIVADKGTEWYLVKSNLGDIEVRDFSVTDEQGRDFLYDGAWDVDKSLAGKILRCGIVTKDNGVELCWGLGSMGLHVFTASYTMTNVVKSLRDYDCVHMQFVSPGLSSNPENVHVAVHTDLCHLNDTCARIWGFGYVGDVNFTGSQVVMQSTEPFVRESSVILLMRLDKGIFSPGSILDKDFIEVLDRAKEGSSYSSEDDGAVLKAIVIMVLIGVVVFVLAWLMDRRNKRNILGVPRIKDIGWSRDIPFGGNILEANYILKQIQTTSDVTAFTSALILRMAQKGDIIVRKDGTNKVELAFAPESSEMSAPERKLLDMMKEAAGDDEILQDKEFSRWSRHHQKLVRKWVDSLEPEAIKALKEDGLVDVHRNFTPEGKAGARAVFGFRKFLKDFTLVDERSSAEAVVWNDYLAFGALFGIADKVMKELKDIDPEILEQTVYMDWWTMYYLMNMSRNLSCAIIKAAQTSSSASSGFGGTSSFGGGGGFSGGGFGGGAR